SQTQTCQKRHVMIFVLSPRAYSVRGPWLHILTPRRTALLLYWGHGLRPLGRRAQGKLDQTYHWLPIDISPRSVKLLAVAPRRSGPWRDLQPGFRRTRAVCLPIGETVRVAIAPAKTELERSAAISLMARRHYLGPRTSGLLLIARLIDGAREKMS